MPKRFVDSNLWSQKWFHDLSRDGKLFFLFLVTHCDHGGLIDYHPEMIAFFTGVKKIEDCIQEINQEKIRVARWRNYIFVPHFLDFQFGTKPFRARDAGVKRLVEVGICGQDSQYTEEFKELLKTLETLSKDLSKSTSSSSINISITSASKKTSSSTSMAEYKDMHASNLKERLVELSRGEREAEILLWMKSKSGFGKLTDIEEMRRHIAESWEEFIDALGRLTGYFDTIKGKKNIGFKYAKRWGTLSKHWAVFSDQGEFEDMMTRAMNSTGKGQKGKAVDLPTGEELK